MNEATIPAPAKSALRKALKAAFPGLRFTMKADKRGGRDGCIRINGRVGDFRPVAQWEALRDAQGGLLDHGVELRGVTRSIQYAENPAVGGCQLMIDAEPINFRSA